MVRFFCLPDYPASARSLVATVRRPESGRDWSDVIAFPAAYSSSAVTDTLILLKLRFFTLEVPLKDRFVIQEGML